jgi:beta-glucanase (GH16 family)
MPTICEQRVQTVNTVVFEPAEKWVEEQRQQVQSLPWYDPRKWIITIFTVLVRVVVIVTKVITTYSILVVCSTILYVTVGVTNAAIWLYQLATLGRCGVEANPIEKPGWTLTFHDEFTGTALDTAKWRTSFKWMARKIANGTGVNPPQWGLYPFYTVPPPVAYYDDSCLTVSDGILKVTSEAAAKHFSYTNPDTGETTTWDIAYRSGFIVTKTFKQQYGYFETRCKLPGSPGAWPAFWMMSDDDPWPPEIDVFEFYTSEKNRNLSRSHILHSTIHWPPDKHKAREHVVCDVSESFNIYGLEWSPESIRWYFNNKLIRNDILHVEQFIYPLYVIIGSGMEDYKADAGKLNDAQFPHEFEVDYVRVYTKT